MIYWEHFIWFFMPIAIHGILAFGVKNKFPITKKWYLRYWLLLVGGIGFIAGPRCLCVNYLEIVSGAVAGALLYAMVTFMLYIVVRSIVNSTQ